MDYYVGDFETTVYKGQKRTDVWASCLCPIKKDVDESDAVVVTSIGETFDLFASLPGDSIIYYHNLKFDGCFWLDYLMCEKGFESVGANRNKKKLGRYSVGYSINGLGAWYWVRFFAGDNLIELRDSMKLLNMSVEAIGRGFRTKYQKQSMVYEGIRIPGRPIAKNEEYYVKCDCLVIAEALAYLFEEGYNKLTIGSCCLWKYKNSLGLKNYGNYFHSLERVKLDPDVYGEKEADAYIRNSHFGGWCYRSHVRPAGVYHNGIALDVNGLYSAVMLSESMNVYPVGAPVFWKGSEIPKEAKRKDRYYFVRIRATFRLKEGHFPFLCKKTINFGRMHDKIMTSKEYFRGLPISDEMEFTMTMTDYALFHEQYNVIKEEILDGCWFNAKVGLFDRYLYPLLEKKANSTGAKREVCKLMLNNLTGKLAAYGGIDSKEAIIDDDGNLKFRIVKGGHKEAGHIGAGSAITSYARAFTIRAAQANADHFLYADTDSLHLDCDIDAVKGCRIHETKCGCWKIESKWSDAVFLRTKSYVERVVWEKGEPCYPYYNIKCSGMGKRCKRNLALSLEGCTRERADSLLKNYKVDPFEWEWVQRKRDISEFDFGLVVPGLLKQKVITGGKILYQDIYTLQA